jgi:sodium pump decarboxylase gamma subunit
VAHRNAPMPESIETGLILMVAGMGTVYILLTALVWIVGLVSRLSRWLDPQPATPSPSPPADVAPRAAPGADELATVIGAAVKAHRDRHGTRR